MPATTGSAILRLISLAAQHPACPCHRCSSPHPHGALHQLRQFATPVHAVQKEYAFEVRLNTPPPCSLEPSPQVAASNLRFGEGVTREVGMDLKNMKARKVLLAATRPFRPCISAPPGRRLHGPHRSQAQANGCRE